MARARGNDEQLTGELLLSHAGFVRSLARRMLADEDEVDDVVQETMVRALQSGPRKREALPAWLRVVTRNLVFKRLRTRARVAEREERAAREERLPSTADLFEREASLERVVTCVLDLPQHYRQVVLWRYFEDLPPRKIAARLGEPVTTIRMRLHRALALLREKLDREYGGDREQRLRGLVLLAGAPSSRWGLSSLLLAVVLLAVASIAAVSWIGRGRAADSAGGTSTSPPLAWGSGENSAPGERPETSVGELAGELAGAQDRTGELDASPRGPLEVLVLDPDGYPQGEAEVLAELGPGGLLSRGRTDVQGRLTLQVPLATLDHARESAPLQLAARGAGGAPSPVTLWPVDRRDPAQVTLRLRPGGESLTGRVTVSGGRPVPRARVEFGVQFRLGQGFLGGVRSVGDGNVGPLLPGLTWAPDEVAAVQFDPRVRGYLGPQAISGAGEFERLPGFATTRTDDEGRFTLHGVEAGDQPLRVIAPGFAVHGTQVDPAHASHLEIVLVPEARVVGHVPGEGGRRKRFVYVFEEARTIGAEVEPDGSFELGGLRAGPARLHLRAGARTADESVELVAGRTTTWNPNPTSAGALRGVLQDSEGRPLDGWRMDLRMDANPTRSFASTVTGPAGAFVLPPPPPGSNQLTATAPGAGTYAAMQVLDGQHDLNPWRLAQGQDQLARLSGRIVEADGTPLDPGTRLILVAEGNPSGVCVHLDAGGAFRSPPLHSGRWRWTLPGMGLASQADRPVPLAGADVDLGQVRLTGVGTLFLPAQGSRTERLCLRRVADDGHRLTIFRGRVSVPCRVPLRAGRWVVRRGADFEQTISVHEGLEVRVE